MKTPKMRFKKGDTVWAVVADDTVSPSSLTVKELVVCHNNIMGKYPLQEGQFHPFCDCFWLPDACLYETEIAAHMALRNFTGVIYDRETKWCKDHAEMFTPKAKRTPKKQPKGEK